MAAPIFIRSVSCSTSLPRAGDRSPPPIRLQLPERALVQLTHIENRATLVPYVGDQSPWRTNYNVLGGTLGTASPVTLAGEYAKGWTRVAFPGGTYRMDFDTAYALLSEKQGTQRYTVRLERFTTRSHISTPDDRGREHGTAYTIAWFHEPDQHFRTGFEYMKVKGDRPGVAAEGFDPRTAGSTLTVEFRYGF
jgi:hypothetical protein